MGQKSLLVATGNSGKVREFESLFAGSPLGVELVTRRDWPDELPDVVEDRETFRGNAIKKALETSLSAGATTLADDSGLEVDALDGRPGVYSARFAGPDATDEANNRHLIESLSEVPEGRRSSRYVAVLALVLADDELGVDLLDRLQIDPLAPASTPADFDDIPEGQAVRFGDRVIVWVRATCEGRIIDEARGEGGFGYDPYFLIDDWGQTMAEVPLAKKNEISHRARAVRKLTALFEE